MIDTETFEIAVKNLTQQKLRSYLTLLGIVIGISVIVALVAIGQGLNVSVEKEFEKIGLDVVFVEPGSGSFVSTAVSRTIEEADIKIIERIPGVEDVAPFYEAAGLVKYGDETAGIFSIGIEIEDIPYLEESGFIGIDRGRQMKKNDKYVVIVPESFLTDAFDKEIPLRQEVEIEGKKFKIIGTIEQSDVAMGGFGLINMFYMPADALKEVYDVDNPVELAVKVTSRQEVPDVVERIERKLEKAHGEKDFVVMSSENMLESASMVIGLIQLFLVGIASISLLVGGIGIMNTMLMAVMERTREIGVMKAIGATRRRILSIFLIEAGLIGLIGGAIGVTLGIIISYGIGFAASAFGFPLMPEITIWLVAGALAFSIGVGSISGLYPSNRASKLDAVEALRYE